MNFLFKFCFWSIIILFSCKQIHSLPVDSFIDSFKDEIEKKDLIEIEKIHEDSLQDIYIINYEKILGILHKKYKLNDIFESNGISNDKTKCAILLISFHRKINKKEVNFMEQIESAKQDIKRYNSYNKKLLACTEKKLEIAKDNFSKVLIGDTLNFAFPTYYNGHKKNAFYYDCPSGYKGDTSEKFIVEGQVISKDVSNFSDSLNTRTLKVEVQNISDINSLFLLREIKMGDTVYIDLEDYGRLLY